MLIWSLNFESRHLGKPNSICEDEIPKLNPLKQGDGNTLFKNGIRVPIQTVLKPCVNF